MLFVNSYISIPAGEFEFTYSRSPGPGGQNVNKVNSKATLAWLPANSPSLPPDVLTRFQTLHRTRITREGKLLITSHRYRDQSRNAEDCLEKLRAMILQATIVPKTRKSTKPSRASHRRRLDTKKKTSQKKNLRRSNFD